MVDSRPPKKIVVAHVILSLEIGGMEQVVVDLVKAIDRGRFEPVVVCLMRLGPLGEELKALGVSIHLLPSMTPIVSFLYPAPLVKILRQVSAEVVHVHSGCWFKGVVGARLCGVKRVIYTLHGATYGRTVVETLLERIAATFTSRIVTVSDDLALQLKEAGHLPMEKVSVIINGIDTERFASVTGNPVSGRVRIGIIARLDPVKDLGTLLRALQLLFDMGVSADLAIVGDGPERERLEALSAELGLGSHVTFHGFQRDTLQRLAEIDIFALSSLREGTSISILEAMAAGRPIVATAVGGNPALIADGVNGLLVPPSDPIAFSQALLKLINHQELRTQMSENNRLKSQQKFSLGAMKEKYEELYSS